MFAIRGTLVHCTRLPASGVALDDESDMLPVVDLIPDGVVGVDGDTGRILFARKWEGSAAAGAGAADPFWAALAEEFPGLDKPGVLRELPPGGMILPGFIDTHRHAPQHAFAGTGMDLDLLGWLEKYTFPGEAAFADEEYAARVYESAVSRSLAHGTTTCVYFASLHLGSTNVLVDTVRRLRQRAFVGKVCMDRNSPDFYIEETADSLRDTEAFVRGVLDLKDDCVAPVVTPRFVPTCSSALMRGLGKVAAEHDIPIQSHVSENKGEVKWVADLHPDCESYTDVYEKHGLLNNRTIMGHGIFLTDAELARFRETGAAVSHCPVSNFNLHSGVLDVKRVLRAGVKLSLGTDVSGGHTASMLEVIRSAVVASNTLQFADESYTPINFRAAFALATLGGARAVGLEDQIGNFVAGKQFDAIVVDPTAEHCPFDVYERDTPDDIFSKFIYLGNEHCITHVYVQGKEVRGR
jgi:guanine deaminase